MGQAVQVNTRMDAELKRQGDAVFARNGISTTVAVRMLWTYAAERGTVPEFMREGMDGSKANAADDAKADAIASGMGLAFAVLANSEGDAAAVSTGDSAALDSGPLDYAALRDAAYDDLLDEFEANHA